MKMTVNTCNVLWTNFKKPLVLEYLLSRHMNKISKDHYKLDMSNNFVIIHIYFSEAYSLIILHPE